MDVPLAAAHFWYYAGWADKLEYAFPGRNPKPLGVAAQVIPWNFPLLMLAWKIAPALAAGQHGRPQAGFVHDPLSALLFADVCRQADLPPGVVNIVTGPGRDRPCPGQASGRRQGRLHRLNGRRQGDRPRRRRSSTRRSPWSWAARRPTSSSTTRRSTRPIEGIVNGIYFNQGEVCCAGSRLLRAGEHRRAVHRQASRTACRRSSRGRPAGQEHGRGRDQLTRPAGKITELVEAGQSPKGAEMYQPACDLPARGWFFRPTLFTNVAQSIASPARRSSGRSCRCSRSGPRPRRSRRPTTRLRPVGRRLDREGQPDPVDGQRLKAGVVWANTFNRFDPTSRSAGTRSRVSAARVACTGSMRTCAWRTAEWRPGSASARRTRCTSAAPSRAPNRAARTT